MNERKIVFFYPSRVVGGMEMLFLRLSHHLSKKTGFKIGYVDFEDGFVAKQLDKNITLYKFNHKKITLTENTVLVSPLSSLVELKVYFNPSNLRVLLWSVHPEGLKIAIENLQRFSLSKKSLIFFASDLDYFIQKKGLFFMDGENFDKQKQYFAFKECNSHFLPIFAEDKEKTKIYTINSIISLGALGRLSIDKVIPILNLLERCNEYLEANEAESIDFHLIGDGEAVNLLKEFRPNGRLKLIFAGTLLRKDLNSYLIKNIDVLFAMGTSALEGASLGLATILLDYSWSSMSENRKFHWLFESEDYSLGMEFNKDNRYQHSFDDICNDIKSGRIADLGKECLKYFEHNHSLASTSDLFIRLIDRTKLEVNDLRMSKFNIFNKIYALKKIKQRFLR